MEENGWKRAIRGDNRLWSEPRIKIWDNEGRGTRLDCPELENKPSSSSSSLDQEYSLSSSRSRSEWRPAAVCLPAGGGSGGEMMPMALQFAGGRGGSSFFRGWCVGLVCRLLPFLLPPLFSSVATCLSAPLLLLFTLRGGGGDTWFEAKMAIS